MEIKPERPLKTIRRLEYALKFAKECIQSANMRDNPSGHPNIITVGDFIIIDLKPELSDPGMP